MPAAVVLSLNHGQTARAYPPARTRTAVNFTVCLVTQPAGISSSPSSTAAWQGILHAQAFTSVRAQSLAVTGPDTPSNAAIAVNTLALRKCNLIVAATPVETAAVNEQAHELAGNRFVILTATPTSTASPNVTSVDTETQQISAQVTALVERDAKSAS